MVSLKRRFVLLDSRFRGNDGGGLTLNIGDFK